MTRRQRAAAIVLGGAMLLGACSSGGSDNAAVGADDVSASSTTTSTTASSTTTGDITAMCAVFRGIADSAADAGGEPSSGPGGGGPAQPTTKEGWDERIERTAKIVDTAPADYRDEAETYLELVEDRAQLAADNGYATVEDLPADVRTAFIADHADEQAQADSLIAFANESCDLG